MSDLNLVGRYKIHGEFTGFDDDMVFKLMNGTYWLQVRYKYWYQYAYCPIVEILHSNGAYFLRLEGHDPYVQVQQISTLVESTIDGEYRGWDGNTQYRLRNGQVWEQAEYAYHYEYAYNPEVLIYEGLNGVTMKVGDFKVRVRRLK